MSRLLIPNLGAEEGREEPDLSRPPVRQAVRLWRGLFEADAVLDRDPDADTEGWPEVLGARPAEPVFPWLAGPQDATAWWVSAGAAERAAREGRSLEGPSPEVVARVHDKAFAQAFVRRERLGPAELRESVESFEPDELGDATQVAARVEAARARWAEAGIGTEATLKPRFGSSGRGRVAWSGDGNDEALAGALPRLAARGGALLEPWLDRQTDLSAVLVVEASGTLRLVGTLEQHTRGAGVCLGHRGTLDRKGRVTSGSPFDEELRENAVQVAAAAAEAGYRGPCGVDAFVYRAGDGTPRLRPVVEFNARFTLGHVSLGMARRALPALKDRVPLDVGARNAFELIYDAPAEASRIERGSACIGLAPALDGRAPILRVDASLAALTGNDAAD